MAKPEHDPGPAELEAQKDHERVSCGLFWTMGKYKPTNHMIVSAHQQYQAVFQKVRAVKSLGHHSPPL